MVGPAIETITKIIGRLQIVATLMLGSLDSVQLAVKELLCYQICNIQLVMLLSGAILIVFKHDALAIRWQGGHPATTT